MVDYEAFLFRLREAVVSIEGKPKVKDKVLAAYLAVTPVYFAVAKKRRKIPLEPLLHFCRRYGISLHWLLLGEGEMRVMR